MPALRYVPERLNDDPCLPERPSGVSCLPERPSGVPCLPERLLAIPCGGQPDHGNGVPRRWPEHLSGVARDPAERRNSVPSVAVADDQADAPAGASHVLREHRAAQSSQRALLPASLPQIDGCHLAARWQPRFDLGGDCYDAIAIGEDRIAISIGDVCGKGLPAALVMSHVQASVRAFAASNPSPAAVAANLNRALCRNAGLAPFVTLFYATYDACTRVLAFTNAGHNPPLLLRADGAIDRLAAGGLLLGVFEHATFEHATVRLHAGDRVILFTDGITDAGGDSREFGDEGLIASVLRSREAPVDALVDRLFEDVSRFAGGYLADDATVMALAIE